MKKYHKKKSATTTNQPSWAELLREAVTKPGRLLEAYSYFHHYSVGNQILALSQCYERGIEPGPISTYPGWLQLKRQVRKGERAIVLCMPITIKGQREEETRDSSGGEGFVFTSFVYKPNWFVMSQTEGEPVAPPPPPAWDRARALSTLSIEEIPFDLLEGNTQGFARRRQISISPIAALPHKTTFHELAHVVLGHTQDTEFTESEFTPRNLKEVEAESVALILCESLRLEGADYARGYIQHWLKGEEIPEKSAQKIFRAADSILKAGAPPVTKEEL